MGQSKRNFEEIVSSYNEQFKQHIENEYLMYAKLECDISPINKEQEANVIRQKYKIFK